VDYVLHPLKASEEYLRSRNLTKVETRFRGSRRETAPDEDRQQRDLAHYVREGGVPGHENEVELESGLNDHRTHQLQQA
jgi:hypothetical protein